MQNHSKIFWSKKTPKNQKTNPILTRLWFDVYFKWSLISPKTSWDTRRFVQGHHRSSQVLLFEGLSRVDLCLWGTFLPLLPTPFTRAVNPTGPPLLGTHQLLSSESGWYQEQMTSCFALVVCPGSSIIWWRVSGTTRRQLGHSWGWPWGCCFLPETALPLPPANRIQASSQ